mgnify:CR=1 FL=1
MSNQNYSEFKSRSQNKNHSKKLTMRKGAYGAEHGSAQKDDPTGWPDVKPHWGTSLNRTAKFPVVKTGVVRKGVD